MRLGSDQGEEGKGVDVLSKPDAGAMDEGAYLQDADSAES